ncbi:ABC transporter ATP-binding protein [Rhodovastum sp. RN2-1]|uniref:ABC transporter ATP-binding protein n=2 Tax=Limobrevibacterium gyesilva TaxID=2991712 RepID=A0AA41YL55_9PROT|nr:ABC transporter ATP-binding protein [Limobrevibacterium gyesilva]MCW3473923.1 ABC transporter ATP-binding protein [Limobrevibacterium gyesilva]
MLHPLKRKYHREHWSLRDINLTIRRGTTVGIVGRNGSGKSTLLQIICSVIHATTGTCEVRGRVAALLELGAGFNPELTGRENAVTNGLIMGLSSREIEQRIEDIRVFADIGEYFDQPVKTYSSGMFMRVAFATAVHVDPDILIIDEAMAVGDVSFQEKCFRKIREFKSRGTTILYVTHDRASVTYFCDEAVLLHDGELIEVGAPQRIIDLYSEILTTGRLVGQAVADVPGAALPAPGAPARTYRPGSDVTAPEVAAFLDATGSEDRCAANPLYNANEYRFGNGGAGIIDFLVVERERINPAHVRSGDTVDIYLKIRFDRDYVAPLVGFTITNAQGVVIFGTHSQWLHGAAPPAAAGDVRCYRFRVRLTLSVGPCFIEVAVASAQGDVSDVRSKMILIEVLRDQMMIGLVNLGPTFEPMT